MKHFIKILFIVIISSTTGCCYAQKMVTKIRDAKKLEINKEQFIGKPLKFLIDQIGPKIKFAYGNPNNKGESIIGTNIKFYFADETEYWKRHKENQTPTAILVTFKLEPNNTRKPIPVGGVKWTAELANEYGDMIISRIYVSGEN
ncbi:MAG: hypothetical protein M3Y85_11800 [Bacteroidota bacterium]|nr:hypothetical protein [Bacteroidota bacterium]